MASDSRWGAERTRRPFFNMFTVSLLLLGTSYLLLLAAPLVSARLSGLGRDGQWARIAHWIPAASGAGLALGGGAALLLVLARLSKDIRRHPYACVAPALAAFSACLLIGLGAKLPLGASEPLCVFALALAVMGGSLVQEAGAAGQLFGWALTVAPAASMVAAVWAASGEAQLSQAIWALSPASRLFLAMLALSSVAMALLGMVARTLGEARGLGAAQAAIPVQHGTWDPNPFSAREDTLELALRSAERELTKRTIGRPALLVLACLLVGGAVAVWQNTTSDSRVASRVARELVTAQPVQEAQVAQAASAPPVPQVEPYVASPAAEPSVANAALEPSGPQAALPVREPEPAAQEPALALALPAEAEATAPSSVVVTSRVPPARKARAARAKLKPAPVRHVAKAAPETKTAKVMPEAEPEQAQVSDKPAALEKPRAEAAREAKAAAVEKARAEPAKEAKPAVAKAPPPPTRGDESLDELMDRVVEPKQGGKSSKSAVVSADDPIFGL
ncbi:MAG: hypothetical protein QM778_30335 [Myxococcales bacterium]